jgi:hypothetical protein
MSEEAPKLDQFKVIPQVFFDLIARVVPGAAGIVAALKLSNTSLQDCLEKTLGTSLATSSSLGVLAILLVAAYAVGQALSPLVKWLQRLGEWTWLNPEDKEQAYDWLRLKHPAAGDQCAKIRAEFMMHNGLAIVLLISAVVYRFRDQQWEGLVLAPLIVGGLLAAYRGRTVRDTYNQTVKKFAAAAGHDVSIKQIEEENAKKEAKKAARQAKKMAPHQKAGVTDSSVSVADG